MVELSYFREGTTWSLTLRHEGYVVYCWNLQKRLENSWYNSFVGSVGGIVCSIVLVHVIALVPLSCLKHALNVEILAKKVVDFGDSISGDYFL